jgi:hypothetical protein
VNYINNNNQYRPRQNQGWTQQRTNYPGIRVTIKVIILPIISNL